MKKNNCTKKRLAQGRWPNFVRWRAESKNECSCCLMTKCQVDQMKQHQITAYPIQLQFQKIHFLFGIVTDPFNDRLQFHLIQQTSYLNLLLTLWSVLILDMMNDHILWFILISLSGMRASQTLYTPGNTKGGSITVWLTSCLNDLE